MAGKINKKANTYIVLYPEIDIGVYRWYRFGSKVRGSNEGKCVGRG